MALQFSPNFINYRVDEMNRPAGFDSPSLVLVKDTVPFPQIQPTGTFNTYYADGSVYQTTTNAPAAATADRIVSFAALSGNVSSNYYFLSGTLSVAATGAGTIGWFYLIDTTTSTALVSNSFGLSGSGSLLTVNSLSFSVGATCTISFNLRLLRS